MSNDRSLRTKLNINYHIFSHNTNNTSSINMRKLDFHKVLNELIKHIERPNRI